MRQSMGHSAPTTVDKYKCQNENNKYEKTGNGRENNTQKTKNRTSLKTGMSLSAPEGKQTLLTNADGYVSFVVITIQPFVCLEQV